MDLTYPPEAEQFRTEIRAWLEDNLPDGWFDDGFEMTDEERASLNKEWPDKLFEGGWICATWPVEYGGKGLTTMQGVVLAEEFATARAPMRAGMVNSSNVAGERRVRPAVSTGTSACGWSISSAVNVTSPPLRSATMVWSSRRPTCPRSMLPDPLTNLSSSQRRGRHVVVIHCRTAGLIIPSSVINPNSVNSADNLAATAGRAAWSL